MAAPQVELPGKRAAMSPFRRAVLRGLGILMPPLLTIAIFAWVGKSVVDYLLEPLESIALKSIMLYSEDIQPGKAAEVGEINGDILVLDGKEYHRTADGMFVPTNVYRAVQLSPSVAEFPKTAVAVYHAYIHQTYLRRIYVVPIFLVFLIALLYFLGRFLAAGVGKFFWVQIERAIFQVPLVRNVYSSVKQVTDFLFGGQEMEFTRVVAVEYPRKGVWSLGMVTGESMLDIRSAANEPVLSLLMPTSPMPFTGFTVTVKKSDAIDLNLTIDQAFQFIVSCGVVVPPHQLSSLMDREDDDLLEKRSRLPEVERLPPSN